MSRPVGLPRSNRKTAKINEKIEKFISNIGAGIDAINGRLNPSGLCVENVPGDGSCFFYAVENQLTAKCPAIHMPAEQLRKRAVSHLRNEYKSGRTERFKLNGLDNEGAVKVCVLILNCVQFP